jgi:adenosylcobinamide-GDP ribazoletransferase
MVGSWANAARLAVGTLTVLRVRPPDHVDRRVGRDAMLLAPVVGLAVGLVAELVSLLVRWFIPGYVDRLLVAVAAVAAMAWLTRGLHLDGLADTADGLGSGRHGADALAVMQRSDIGPFGVVTLVLVLLLQVAALYTALNVGRGTLALVGGAMVSRLAVTWACRRGVPGAKSTGLGSLVAATVPNLAALVVTACVGVLLGALVWFDDDVRWDFEFNVLVGLVAALVVTQLLVHRCVRRFGGVTGDVLGAVAEVAFLVFVLVVAVR